MTTRALEPSQVELSGVHLVEASAGTGKTHAIVSLYMRMLAQTTPLLTVDRLLVVTFTEAATAELKLRLRRRLEEAVEQLAAGTAQDEVVAHFLSLGPASARRIQGQLEQALRSFDEAEVHTIHGLCRRVLEQHGMEFGIVAGVDILADTSALFEEIVRQYLAQEVYAAPSWYARLVRDLAVPSELVRLVGEASLLAELERSTGRELIDPAPKPRDDERYASVTTAFGAARRVWQEQKLEAEELLRSAPGLNKTAYGPAKLPALFDKLERFFTAKQPDLGFEIKNLRLVAQGEIKTNKGHDEPRHPLFDRIRCLVDQAEGFADLERRQFVRRLVTYAAQVAAARKLADGVLTFDDLVLRLEHAMHGPMGDKLVSSLRSRFHAALVDEFQDTDAQQWEVLRRVFVDGGIPLFLIGDPKQAIYGFRGADVHAYFQAKTCVSDDNLHTLRINRRTEAPLVRAVNAMFGRTTRPFGDAAIPFEPASPRPADADADAATWEPPAVLVFLTRQAFARPSGKLSQTDAVAIAAQLLAEDLERRRPFDAQRSVAVLVRSNRQVDIVLEALRARGIAAVAMVEGNVFKTQEAAELSTVFAALLDVSDQPKIRSALLTPLFGATCVELARVSEDDREWSLRLAEMAHFAEHWARSGALAALRRILAGRGGSESRAEQLLRHEAGRGKLVHYEHIAELMSVAARETGSGLAEQLRWLEARRSGDSTGGDVALRLSADNAAVRVLTVHKSKGLEFDEVYCPYLWSAVGRRRSRLALVSYHDAAASGARRGEIMPAPDSPAWQRASAEQFDEELRLTYVALTRAKRRCVVFDGAFEPGQRALSWLLHPDAAGQKRGQPSGETGADEALLSDVHELAESTRDASGRPVFEVLVPSGPPPARVTPAAAIELAATSSVAPRPRALSVVLGQKQETLSFTALAAQRDAFEASAEHDRGESPDGEALLASAPKTELRLAAFERGPRAGEALHEVLEQVAIGEVDEAAMARQTRQSLEKHGFDAERWTAPVSQGLAQVRDTCLGYTVGKLRLRDLQPEAAAAELEFLLPLDDSGAKGSGPWPVRAAKVFEAWGGEHAVYASHVAALAPRDLRGYLHGFIDLVFEHGGRFYIVDYKSNYLGESGQSYGKGPMIHAMHTHHYVLQYSLYSIALERYLAWRLPQQRFEDVFGGVYYLFLRGMSFAAGGGEGVCFDRPSPEGLAELSSALGLRTARGDMR